MTQTILDPDNYLETTQRALHDYVAAAVDSDIYTVQMSYPPPDMFRKEVPLNKTIIAFEMEDEESEVFGLNWSEKVYDESTDKVVLRSPHMHHIHFHVSIWASAESGSDTSRLRARQLLSNIFSSTQSRAEFKKATQGITIREFSGGRSMIDEINDIPVWRMTDATLVLTVIGRSVSLPIQAVDRVVNNTTAQLDDDGNVVLADSGG